ncbi:MAG: GTP-binding protein, partial [Candidatus Lokiarchaeota archaeon]|nr:GTP-binding protein [Candidatus Lokiarchaeota archaeon]MBD3200472.1 GTP-binding protein [Candidatus Lokiarchaeota archaeon]
LIGNKIDLENKIKISSEEGKEYAKKHNMEFIQTSAKEGSNVEEAFKELMRTIISDISS